MSSISTQAPSGICATPKALRAWAPRSAPNTATISSEAPLVTRCCSVKLPVLFTRLISLTMRLTLSSPPEGHIGCGRHGDVRQGDAELGKALGDAHGDVGI